MFHSPGQLAREANAHVDALADDERCRAMTAREALWNGTAHDGKPSFWEKSVPLIERSPAVQSGILATAGRRLANMVFGERAFPGLHVESTAYGVALTESERDALSALVVDVVRAARLSKTARAYLLEGLKTGSACAVCEIREGRPVVAILPAKWCTPALDGLGRVLSLVVQYKHTGADGVEYWHRRVIGDGFDRVYDAVKVTREAPRWDRVPVIAERAIPFVPVVWTRNAPEAVEDGHAIDGHALCEGIEDEILALDLELSQLFRNALYNGDPQLVRMGVEGAASSPMGAQGRAADPDKFSWLSPSTWGARGEGGATKKAPGTIWNLPQGADAKMLESTGAGAQIIRGAYDELRRAIVDTLGVVLADPQSLGGGDLSARALALMFGPMVDTASSLRVDYGDALVEIVAMLCRLATETPGGVYLASLDAARPAMTKLYGVGEDGARAWLGMPITCAWGEFFEPSWSDITAAIGAAQRATGGRPVLSQRAALRLVAPVVGVEDVDAEASEIDREMGGDASAMRDTLGAMQPSEDAPSIAPETAVQDTAHAVAQVDSMVTLAKEVAAGTLPLETAAMIMVHAFQMSPDMARALLLPAAQMIAARAPASTSQTEPAPVADGSRPIE